MNVLLLITLLFSVKEMPSKSRKRKKGSLNLRAGEQIGRQHKKVERLDKEPETVADLLNLSHQAKDTDNEEDPSFELDSSIKSNTHHLLDTFCEEWVAQVSLEDRILLGIFVQYQLLTVLQKGETEFAELAALMIGKSDRTIRDWKAQFLENVCEIPDNKQGHYQRSGVLWQYEDLNKKASKYIRENAAVKGRPNLTACSFCEWVNKELLANETLELGFPRKISVETARHWLHELRFEVLAAKKVAMLMAISMMMWKTDGNFCAEWLL